MNLPHARSSNSRRWAPSLALLLVMLVLPRSTAFAQFESTWTLPDGKLVSIGGTDPGPGGAYPVEVIADGSAEFVMIHESVATGQFLAARFDRDGNLFQQDPVNATPFDSPVVDEMVAVTDGAGGAIVIWAENRSDSPNASVFAQRMDDSMGAVWGAHGLALDEDGIAGSQNTRCLQAIDDAKGGAIAGYIDEHGGFSVSGIDHAGNLRFRHVLETGLGLAATCPSLAQDGRGGAYAVWAVGSTLSTRRIEPQGEMEPASSTATVSQPASIVAIGDRQLGLVVAYRAGGLRLQRFDTAGNPLWTPAGVLVSGSCSGLDDDQVLAADGEGGVLVAYTCLADVYAQRVDGAGAPRWGTGSVVSSAGDRPRILSNGRGGALVTWRSSTDLRAQRLRDTDGSVEWSSYAGILFGNQAGCSGTRRIYDVVEDGAGGLVAHWRRCDGAEETANANRLRDADVFAVASRTLAPDSFVLVCPGGLQDSWRVDFILEGNIPSGLSPQDVTLRPGTGQPWYFADSMIEADSPVSPFFARFEFSAIGGSAVGWVPIYVLDEPAGMAYLSTRSADFNVDGSVNLADIGMFAPSFGKCPASPGYDWRVNLDNGDACIDLADVNELAVANGCSDL